MCTALACDVGVPVCVPVCVLVGSVVLKELLMPNVSGESGSNLSDSVHRERVP
jgi:hypothetical protein